MSSGQDFRRIVLWRKAMAAKGIKVLAMGMTPAEEGQALHELEGAKAERA